MSETPNPALPAICETLSARYYEGKLPHYTLIFKRLVRASKEGETRPEKNQIWIASQFEQGLPENSPTRYALERTLKHEMVHVELFVEGAKDWDLHRDNFTIEAGSFGRRVNPCRDFHFRT